jgi:hypothetical protein
MSRLRTNMTRTHNYVLEDIADFLNSALHSVSFVQNIFIPSRFLYRCQHNAVTKRHSEEYHFLSYDAV